MDRGVLGDSLGGSLGDYLREQRRAARLSLRQLAERAEVSNPYLSQVERGLRQPSAQVLNQIARGLRISTHALYVRAGLLADELLPDEHRSAGGPSAGDPVPVRTAVQDDPHLLERHKLLLLDLYDTFRRDAAADPHPDPHQHQHEETASMRNQS